MSQRILVDNDGIRQTVAVGALPGAGLLNSEVLTAARVLTADDSGKTFFLALAGGFTVTLPAVALASGFRARFVVKVAPTTAYIIASAEGDNIAGSVLSSSGGAEDTEAAATADQINFVASAAVVGDFATIESDGAKFYGLAVASATGGVTYTG